MCCQWAMAHAFVHLSDVLAAIGNGRQQPARTGVVRPGKVGAGEAHLGFRGSDFDFGSPETGLWKGAKMPLYYIFLLDPAGNHTYLLTKLECGCLIKLL